ncbi:MAG: RNA polymerase sigma factor RpoD/SigA [bacterium]|jgi:RNA polymerase primary sigma factor|nr:RNA polymerase sigma factor RpoD/SigA [bacterium]MBK9473617.1 RNA polymerase sigma factor RpoD/SigA [bacterium]
MAGKRNFLPAMHEKGLEVYFRDINRYELLTREQEFELARGIRAGDEEALQTLVRANLRFVVSVAKRYVNQGLMLSDLINEGNLGLLKAAHRFDEERGYRFISYAVWWIRQSIMQALLDKSRTIRLPQNQTAVLIKINRARVQLQQQGMTDPRPGQLAEHLGIKRSEVLQALKADHTEVALDDVGADGSDRPLAEVIEDTTQASPDAAVLERGLREDVRRCLAVLSEREAQVVVMYFGLGWEEAQTLQVIGERLGLTRERIRQIKEKALAKLRLSSSHVVLQDYY